MRIVRNLDCYLYSNFLLWYSLTISLAILLPIHWLSVRVSENGFWNKLFFPKLLLVCNDDLCRMFVQNQIFLSNLSKTVHPKCKYLQQMALWFPFFRSIKFLCSANHNCSNDYIYFHTSGLFQVDLRTFLWEFEQSGWLKSECRNFPI